MVFAKRDKRFKTGWKDNIEPGPAGVIVVSLFIILLFLPIITPLLVSAIILWVGYVWPSNNLYRIITFIFTLSVYFVLNTYFDSNNKWPPEEKKYFKEFKSETLRTNWIMHNTGRQESQEYYYDIKMFKWEEMDKSRMVRGARDFYSYKNSDIYDGIMYKEMHFGKWLEATLYGCWKLNSNSEIAVKWVFINGSHSVGWFRYNYGQKRGWLDIEGESIFTPLLLKDGEKAYKENNKVKYSIREPFEIDFNLLKWGAISLVFGIFIHFLFWKKLEKNRN